MKLKLDARNTDEFREVATKYETSTETDNFIDRSKKLRTS